MAKYYSAKDVLAWGVSALSQHFLSTLEGGIRHLTGTFEAIWCLLRTVLANFILQIGMSRF